MAEVGDPYVDVDGRSLFDQVLTAYDRWLDGVPYAGPGDTGAEAHSRRELMHEVYPAVRLLCIRMEANKKGELASRIERDFRDVEDYARIIDEYCESEEFDLNLWLYGDLSADRIATVNESPAALLERARALEWPQADEDFLDWLQGREWALDVGNRCEKIEIEKYGHTAMSRYAYQVACWAWTSFWLAVQLSRQDIDHHGAYGSLEAYLSSEGVVSETKYPVIQEALGRAYGMHIHPFEPMEKDEVQRAIENFGIVVTETQEALSMVPSGAGDDGPPAGSADESGVTLIEFLKQYCRDGNKLSSSILDRYRNALQNADKFGTITLPDNVGKWKTGKAKFYRPSDLAGLWDEYCEEIPDLPLLTPTAPPQTA
jgi:hypothetical protein